MSPSGRRRPAPASAADVVDLLLGQPGVTPAVRRAYREALRRFGHRPEVTGIDVGFKVKGGRERRQLAVRIHVREKFRPASLLSKRERFPRSIRAVPVDVLQSNFRTSEAVLTAEAGRRERNDPMAPGISVSHVNGRPGTLGAFVKDAATGAWCLLTAAHVLLDDPDARFGDAVIQPARHHGGRPQDRVATLWKVNRDTDAGVATLAGGRRFDVAQLGSGAVLASARLPRIGDLLEKSGQRTGVTRGRVQGIGTHAGRPASFYLVPAPGETPQLSDSGDSGSVWYDPATREAVGVHVRGPLQFNPEHEYAVATPIWSALRILRVDLAAR
jgi:endonuclease G